MFQLWYTPESNGRIYCNLNGNELEKYESIYANTENANTENSKESIRDGVLFS